MPIKAVATPQEAARRVNAAKTDALAAALAPVIGEIRASGIITPYAIAAASRHAEFQQQGDTGAQAAQPPGSAAGTLVTVGSQMECRESSLPNKGNRGKPGARKALLSRPELIVRVRRKKKPRRSGAGYGRKTSKQIIEA
jgi:hypothetical protein